MAMIITPDNDNPSQVTQSCVDQYLDSILLQTIYTSAHQEALASMGLPAPKVWGRLSKYYFDFCHSKFPYFLEDSP